MRVDFIKYAIASEPGHEASRPPDDGIRLVVEGMAEGSVGDDTQPAL